MASSKRYTIITVLLLIIVVAVGLGIYFTVKHNKSSRGSRAIDSLKFLVIVTRHGNRSPLYGLPANDPYPPFNSTYWPFADSLSTVGRSQMYNLGLKLRSLYNGFLDSQYFVEDLYVSSTFLPRAIQSAQMVLAGLYPPSGAQIWNKNLLWNPIPIHVDSTDKTQFKDLCPEFETLENEVKAEYRTTWAQNLTYFNNYTSTALNSNVSGTLGVLRVWDALLSDDVEGYKLPDWAAAIYPDPMYPMMNDMYVEYVSATDEMTRLVIGPFFAVMIDVMQNKVDGTLTPNRSVYLWSGHDDTLIALQATLGISKEDIEGVVTPGSAMLYEIHKDVTTGNHFIEVLYVNGTSSTYLDPVPLQLPVCSSMTSCDFDTFVNNTAKFANLTEAKWSEICGNYQPFF